MKVSGWRRWVFRLLLAGVLAIGLGYLPYRVYGPSGMARALRLERELDQLVESNGRLERENRRLRQQIHNLKQDTSYIEQVARDELGMVRPGDVVFQFRH